MPVSKVLKDKTAEEIQHPVAKPFEVAGKSYSILPMPDGILVSVVREIGIVSTMLKTLADKKVAAHQELLHARRELGEEISAQDEAQAAMLSLRDFSYSEMVELLPDFIEMLLPSASKIIAASLRQSEEWVQDTLFYRDRLRALKLILEAEDIPLLMGEFTALAGIFRPKTPSAGPAPIT